MQSVLEKLPVVAFLIGEQEVSQSALYRRSSFCVLSEVRGGGIAFNTLTKELVTLSSDEFDLLRAESVSANAVSEPLIKSYFLVPADSDERKVSDGVCKFVRSAKKGDTYRNYTVFTTTECNARCFYCYEEGCKKSSMSNETAKKTADFIARNCGGNNVEITWYGGEPLVNRGAMDIISGELAERGVEFSSILATNASLLDRELVAHARDKWNVKKAQVTLDGTREVYERIKAYTDRECAFDTVISNIELMLEHGIKVNIRLNVDSHNIDDLQNLCTFLAERFAGKKGINVYFALLFDCDGAKRPLKDCDRLEMAKRIIELEDKLSESGVLKPRRLAMHVVTCFCKADSFDSVVITADGKLVKCDFYTDTHTVGDVGCGIDREALEKEEKLYLERLDCKGCSAYPICLRRGGCPTGGCDSARRYLTEQRLVRSVRYAYSKTREQK